MGKKYLVHISARYTFTFMAMLGLTVAFMMRACLSMVITGIVVNTNTSSLQDKTKYGVSDKSDKFHWSEEMQGIILSSFYCGYIVTHIPGGILAEKFGGKYVFGLGILATAIFTLFTPLVLSENPLYVIIFRTMAGVGEGVVIPSLYTLLAQWAPPQEKGLISTIILLGGQVGTFISNFLGGYILQNVPDNSWKLVFYAFGISGIVWYLFWQFLCYNDPKSHPFISHEEKLFFEKEVGSIERKKNLKPTPWKDILTSGPVWALILTEMGHDWGMCTIITDLPKYLNDVMNYKPMQNGKVSGYPYLSIIFVSWMASVLNDRLLKNEIISTTACRKLFVTISSIGPAVGILGASYVHDTNSIILCLVFGMGCLGFCFSSIKINALDLSPNYSGSITAIVNGFGCISSMLAPYAVGILTTNRSIYEWRTVFWIMACMFVISNFIFVIFGSCERQSWNDLEEDLEKTDESKIC